MKIKKIGKKFLKFLKKNLSGIFSLIAVCLYPCLFMYFRNVGEASITDVSPIIELFLKTALIIAVVFWVVLRNLSKAITITNISMLFVCNFELIANLFKNADSKIKYGIPIVAAIIVLVAVTVVLYGKKEEIAQTVNGLFLLVFTVLILMNAIPAIPTIIHKNNMEVERNEDVYSLLNVDSVNTWNGPNIYYMIFDEYAGPENLDYFYAVDNAEFYNFMKEKNFNVSSSSYNLESIHTCTIVPNLVNLDYVVKDEMPEAERTEYMNNPTLYSVMKTLGYDINTVSFPNFLDDTQSRNSYSGGTDYESKAGYFVLENSAFIHWYKKYKKEATTGENKTELTFGESVKEAIEYFKSFPKDSKRASKKQFHMAYFQAPHVPFCFDAEGNPLPDSQSMNWNDPDIYLGCLKWVSGRIEEIVDEILKEDPKSIIIVQSDHGARYVRHGGELNYNVEGLDKAYERNILNCVYYKGKTLDIEGLSGINTIRKILNEQYGTKMEMLEYKEPSGEEE